MESKNDEDFKKLVQSIAKDKKGNNEINPRYWNNEDLSSFLKQKGIKDSSLLILSKIIENKII